MPGIAIQAQQLSQLSVYSSALYDAVGIAAYSAFVDDCVVSRPQALAAYGTNTRALLTEQPGFNAAARDDYRLRSESALNDYCDGGAFAASFRDLVLTPRCHDDPRKADAYGNCDVGAYESDHVFGAGFP